MLGDGYAQRPIYRNTDRIDPERGGSRRQGERHMPTARHQRLVNFEGCYTQAYTKLQSFRYRCWKGPKY